FLGFGVVLLLVLGAGSAEDRYPVPAGYKWASDLGVLIAVPKSWRVVPPYTALDRAPCSMPVDTLDLWHPNVNPGGILIGCGSYVALPWTEGATVVPSRSGQGFPIMPSGAPRPVTVDGEPALRSADEVGYGQPIQVWEGYLIFTSLGVSVYISANDEQTMLSILDSVHLR
ncbi:MAG TPA: hypothetical protein VGJ28_25205, partial [Micromonosporaceae bacterium]